MLRSRRGRFIFACVMLPNQLVKLRCTVLSVNGADNRGYLADRLLHLLWPTPSDRSSPHVHALSRGLGPHQITCHFDIGANVSPLLYFRSIRRSSSTIMLGYVHRIIICDTFCIVPHTPCVRLVHVSEAFTVSTLSRYYLTILSEIYDTVSQTKEMLYYYGLVFYWTLMWALKFSHFCM